MFNYKPINTDTNPLVLSVLLEHIQARQQQQTQIAPLQFLTQKPMSKVGACGEMNGFIRQVQGDERANETTPQQAVQLINAAQTIEKASGC